MAIGVTTSYVTVPEADVYLKLNATWLATDFAVKEDALLQARYYIDSSYSGCFDQESPPDEVKYASSLLGADYISSGDLFYSNSQAVKMKRTKAGSVETEKEFVGAGKAKPTSIGQVDAIMASLGCIKTSGTVFLMRA